MYPAEIIGHIILYCDLLSVCSIYMTKKFTLRKGCMSQETRRFTKRNHHYAVGHCVVVAPTVNVPIRTGSSGKGRSSDVAGGQCDALGFTARGCVLRTDTLIVINEALPT
jgi:hypothetical protein